MLFPSLMAWIAAASTTAGTGVSHTPCARLMPPMRSHSVVIARISDCSAPGASWLRESRDAAGTGGIGEDPYSDILHFEGADGALTGEGVHQMVKNHSPRNPGQITGKAIGAP